MDGLINNPLHVAIHIACFWLAAKLGKRFNFFSHNTNSVSSIVFSIFILFFLFSIGIRFFNIYIGFFNGNDPEVINLYKRNWMLTICFGFVIFSLGYVFTIITARMGITKPYEPEGTWVYGDICLKSIRNALVAHQTGEKRLSELLVVLDANYRSIPWEAASKRWKKDLQTQMEELRKLDSVDFEGGREGLSASEQDELYAVLNQMDTQLAQAEIKLKRCFEGRKHKPGQWYR